MPWWENAAMAEAARKTVMPVRDEEAPRPQPPLAPAPAAPGDKRTRKRTPGAEDVRRLRRRQRTRWILFALVPLALIIGAYFYVTGGREMSTDDAYVQADRVGISTDVSGIVQEVNVKDNEHVDAGKILYRLDPRQVQIALDNAKANLAQIGLSIEAMKQDYKRMLSDTAAEQAQVDLDQTNYDRAAMLLKSGTGTQATYDHAQYTLENNKSKLAGSRERADVQLARLGGNPDLAVADHPQYRQAQAQVDEAQRQLDH